ncbi:MAG TPA: DoxX family protein, partial [Polyangiaceae bacterium]|nr:DoxX family protein [Polyangiaceae bacterium]
NFIPPPSGPIPEGAAAFGAALMHTGYLFQLLKGTEVLAGALLLSNRFVPLALAVLAPIVINIFAFHAFLAPAQISVAVVVLGLEVYLAWSYRSAFRPMLSPRATAE